MTAPTVPAPFAGLSCYTANLAAYLAHEWDAGAMVTASVRLAVGTEGRESPLAFSHHDPPLDALPDGTHLRYAMADPTTALAAITTELVRYGRALVVVDASRLPWSPAHPRGPAAPHWLLVDSRRPDRWHVVDEFTSLLPDGVQHPYRGWLTHRQLLAAMALPAWRPEHRLRNRLAFGRPVPLPRHTAGRVCWLRRANEPARPRPWSGRWWHGDAQVLPLLIERWSTAARQLPDWWAAAGHRCFAYRWRLAHDHLADAERHRLAHALELWQALPRVLRFAVEAAERGRPRPTLVRRAVEELLAAERALAAARPTHRPAHEGVSP